MEILWYSIITLVFAVFFILDGYDFGVGIIHFFFAKSEQDKKIIAKAAGLFWDSNEVWLVAAGGLLFMAFPTFYASIFSGFYLPLTLVLWLIIFRAIGLELRNQLESTIWKSIWDKSFGLSSLLLALFFGVGLGNLIRGVNLGGVTEGKSIYEAHYFFLPLWNSNFSPNKMDTGILDWFTLVIGIIAVITLAIHGANWIILKTNSSINEKLKSIVLNLNSILLVFTIFSICIWHLINPNPFQNFIDKPYLFLFPILYIIGLVGLFFIKKIKRNELSFVLSSLLIVGGISSSLASMFPVILPSRNSINESLTIYNTSTETYGLSVAMGWGLIGIILLLIYAIAQKKILAGKIDDMDYGH